MEHAARLRGVLDLDRVADPSQASERSVSRCARSAPLRLRSCVTLTVLTPRAPGSGSGAGSSSAAARGSSDSASRRPAARRPGPGPGCIDSPRSSATSRGVRSSSRPLIVALTRLIGFWDPRLFDRMSWIPGQLEDGADAAAGDDAGPLGGGLEQHLARAEAAQDRVRDRRAVLGHAEEVLLRGLDALLDGDGDLVGLAVADADHAVLVADDDERGEGEPAAALDDLGDAVDLDDPLTSRRRRGSRNDGLGACAL